MMQNGLLDEVRALASSGFTDALTSRQAIGYKELLDYLSGSLTLEEAIKLIKLRSRRYAKRQISWFGRDDRIVWLDCWGGCDWLGLPSTRPPLSPSELSSSASIGAKALGLSIARSTSSRSLLRLQEPSLWEG